MTEQEDLKSEGAEGPPNTDLLKSKLKEFASLDTSAREKALKDLSDLIGETLTDQVISEKLVSNTEFQEALVRASELTLATPIEVEGEPQYIWDSGYAVAALNTQGELLGITSKPTVGLEEYGYLGIYALRKAVYELHLEKMGRKGGLSKPANFAYIASLGLKIGEDLFTGSVEIQNFKVGDVTHRAFIGGSGCAVKKEYLANLLGGATPAPETQAGLFDREFCGITSTYISAPTSEPRIKTLPESPNVQQVRINN